MHIAKLQEKQAKFKHGLGGLQEGLRHGPPLMDHNYNGNGLINKVWINRKPTYMFMENYASQCPLGEKYFKVTRSHHYCL